MTALERILKDLEGDDRISEYEDFGGGRNMIKCDCGHENKILLNPRYWADCKEHIGECHGCKTSIHFIYKENGEIERAPLSAEALERIKKLAYKGMRFSA